MSLYSFRSPSASFLLLYPFIGVYAKPHFKFDLCVISCFNDEKPCGSNFSSTGSACARNGFSSPGQEKKVVGSFAFYSASASNKYKKPFIFWRLMSQLCEQIYWWGLGHWRPLSPSQIFEALVSLLRIKACNSVATLPVGSARLNLQRSPLRHGVYSCARDF